ncbi:MAG: hypothetical protein AAFO06_20250, partial [Cyanobacteria bacterium J06597_16]
LIEDAVLRLSLVTAIFSDISVLGVFQCQWCLKSGSLQLYSWLEFALVKAFFENIPNLCPD